LVPEDLPGLLRVSCSYEGTYYVWSQTLSGHVRLAAARSHRKEVARLPRSIRPLVALAAFAAAIALPGMARRRRGHMISWRSAPSERWAFADPCRAIARAG
jgi:hypothetical protein